MVLDINRFKARCSNISLSLKRRDHLKRECNALEDDNKLHRKIDEYDAADFETQKKLLEDNRPLRNYILLRAAADKVIDILDEEKSGLIEFIEGDKIVILKRDNMRYICELDTREIENITALDSEEYGLLVDVLKSNGLFICETTDDMLPLLTVINNDVPYKYEKTGSHKGVNYQGINFDILIEFVATNYEMYSYKNNKEIEEKIDKEIYELEIKYANSEIGEDEFYIRYYYLLIISGRVDLEIAFEEADEKTKNYLIEAYSISSSYSEYDKNDYQVHIRTKSSLINKELLRRKY